MRKLFPFQFTAEGFIRECMFLLFMATCATGGIYYLGLLINLQEAGFR
jgi:hypothetical protein